MIDRLSSRPAFDHQGCAYISTAKNFGQGKSAIERINLDLARWEGEPQGIGLGLCEIQHVGAQNAKSAEQKNGGQFFAQFLVIMGIIKVIDKLGGQLGPIFACVGKKLGPNWRVADETQHN